jgi:hypothetical protein
MQTKFDFKRINNFVKIYLNAKIVGKKALGCQHPRSGGMWIPLKLFFGSVHKIFLVRHLHFHRNHCALQFTGHNSDALGDFVAINK